MPGEVYGQTRILLHHGNLRKWKGTEKMCEDRIETEEIHKEINECRFELINLLSVSLFVECCIICVCVYMFLRSEVLAS